MGDNIHSYGDFSSIQDAINALPQEGGKICILKGTYEEELSLLNRQNVTIEGCGKLSHIKRPSHVMGATISIFNCQDIILRNLKITSLVDQAISVGNANLANIDPECENITFNNLSINGREAGAIIATPVRNIEISNCDINFEELLAPSGVLTSDGSPKPGLMPAIVTSGENIIIKENSIIGTENLSHRAYGTIHIMEGCQRVRILNNRIHKIGGMGIALGSYVTNTEQTINAYISELGFEEQEFSPEFVASNYDNTAHSSLEQEFFIAKSHTAMADQNYHEAYALSLIHI